MNNKDSRTAPNPEQMRALADELAYEARRCRDQRDETDAQWYERFEDALRAAADQLEAVQGVVGQMPWGAALLGLRIALAENAPHGKGCASLCSPGHANYGICDCWKADAR